MSESRPAAERKNVLLIMADDFNHWLPRIGYNTFARTPNIDSLANMGVTFADTSSSSPVCSPSRQAFWSGLSPARTDIDDNDDPYIRDVPEYAEALTLNQHFLQQGYFVYGGGKLYHSSRMGVGETDAENWSGVYEDPDDSPLGAPEGNFFRWKAVSNGGQIAWSASDAPIEDTADTKLALHMAEQITGYATSENSGKPFFLALGFYRPHLPWHAPKRFYDMYNKGALEVPQGFFEDDLVDIRGAVPTDEHLEIVANTKWLDAIRAYLASMSFVDYNVGIVLDALAASPYRDNTIVVFAGDHGWHLGEKHRWKKSALYDQASRTTLIIYDPGRTTTAGLSNKPVSLLDVYPTIASLAGLNVPDQLDGRNLGPLLDAPNDPNWDFPIVMRYAGVNIIKTSEWRFVDFGRRSQLYDTVNDPYEFDNLYDESQYAGTIASLQQQLAELTTFDAYEPPPAFDAPPTITLTGSANVTITEGNAYQDAGAVASDVEDGDLTNRIVVNNPVDTSTPGTYTVSYTVADSGGNQVEILRTVVVAAMPVPRPPAPQSGGGGGGALSLQGLFLGMLLLLLMHNRRVRASGVATQRH